MAPQHVAELQNFGRRMPSEAAYYAAMAAAQGVEAVDAPNLIVVEAIGAPSRRVFTKYPELTEWLRLERTCVMEHRGHTFVHTDALH